MTKVAELPHLTKVAEQPHFGEFLCLNAPLFLLIEVRPTSHPFLAIRLFCSLHLLFGAMPACLNPLPGICSFETTDTIWRLKRGHTLRTKNRNNVSTQ